MTITLINCKEKLVAKNIDMETIGSGEILSGELLKYTSFISWEYLYIEDQLTIFLEGETLILDLSSFGDVVEVPNDNFMG